MKILTFDIEDWFHILDNKKTKAEKNWINYESRLDYGVQLILDIVERQMLMQLFLFWVGLLKNIQVLSKKFIVGVFRLEHTHTYTNLPMR